jgi:hypothetical protein
MLKIPPRLAELLAKQRDLQTAVNSTLTELEPWIEAGGKRPTFFPDYTDHSVQHIEEVLETAVSLIRDEAWDTFSAGDAAVLILATLLHDAAMHLTREGFQAIMDPESVWVPLAGFDSLRWRQMWGEFALEVRRFDQRRLLSLFGDAEPVQVPDLDNLILDDRARRLIGEFIRRHHHRLAHEIARYGVPGSGTPLRVHGNREMADLAGLVARSHGIPARTCLPYLKSRFGSRTDPLGVHPIFLIVLLRVADFLQLQAGRAPEGTLKVHRIHSPYSVVEWKVHLAVRDMREHEEDPEAVYVRANPDDVDTYLRLKDWLDNLQDEIDASWAVLGEVYARQSQGMERLGIRVRRIYSNLDQEKAFANTVNYLPSRIAFSTAGADLLKLLIGPLYGDRPEIGVRELLQNAVDAVREYANMRARNLLPADPTVSDPGGDVCIELDKDSRNEWWLIIRDRGIGMTQGVLCNYFLKAGASFRHSDAWRSQFLDESDHSRVLRTGRFGIGALAAFLLGDELQVTTRHASEAPDQGLAFSASIDTDPIHVYHMTLPVGTTVKVKLSANAVSALLSAHTGTVNECGGKIKARDLWDWYCLAWPKVARRINPFDYDLEQQHVLPGESETLPVGWHRLIVKGYQDIQWTYSWNAPAIICNGIPLEQSASHLESTAGLPLRLPNVSIFDPDARLPVTLRRDRLATQRLPFYNDLLTEILRDYSLTAFSTAPEHPLQTGENAQWYAGLMYDGIAQRHKFGAYGHWGSVVEGIIPIQSTILWEHNAQEIVFLPLTVSTRDQEEFYHVPRVRDSDLPLVLPTPAAISGGEEGISSYFISLLEMFSTIIDTRRTISEEFVMSQVLAAYSLTQFSLIVPMKIAFRAREELVGRRRDNPLMDDLLAMLDLATKVRIGSNYALMFGEKRKKNPFPRRIAEFASSPTPIAHCWATRRSDGPRPSAFAEFWSRSVPGNIIPYKQEDRAPLLNRIRSDRARLANEPY